MMLIKFQRQLETVEDVHNPEHETVSDTQRRSKKTKTKIQVTLSLINQFT